MKYGCGSRHPKGYSGTKQTNKRLSEVLSEQLAQLSKYHVLRPDLILLAWPDVIGPQLSKMTKAQSFQDGVLTVIVKTSTLYALLCQYNKVELLGKLRRRFPGVTIADIQFRVG